jgi:hypothetical protein
MSRLSELARAREREARAKRRAQDETDLAEREAARAKAAEREARSQDEATERDDGEASAPDRQGAEGSSDREEEPRRRGRRGR